MKTAELIRRLQEADPSGEAECVVGGQDIYFVSAEPGYYDGEYQVLVHDPAKRDRAWSIVGAIVTRRGTKVRLHVMGIRDCLLDMPDMPVTLDLQGQRREEYQATIEMWRAEMKQINAEVDAEMEKMKP